MTYTNGASPAAGIGLLDRMAANGNDQIFLNQLSTISAELTALRAEIAGLSRQVTKLEALDTHNDVEKALVRMEALTARVNDLEKAGERSKGKADAWKIIISILSAITMALSIWAAFKH